MSGLPLLLDHTRYGRSMTDSRYRLSKEGLTLLQKLQEELNKGNCVFLASDPREEEEHPQVVEMLDQDTVQIQSYVGAVSFRGETITIQSQFDKNKKNPWFLQYLLENTWGASSLFMPEGPIGLKQQEFCIWQLVGQLAIQLQTAWKKGIFRTYQGFAHYDSRVRGQLDIPRYIRLSMGCDDGRMAYRTREYSPDNPYNRLILCAISAAEQQYPQLVRRLFRQLPEYKAAVQFLRQQISGWERDQPRILLERTRRKITHPIYRGYEGVRLTARAILQWLGRESFAMDQTVGILLNMDQLWEKFLAKNLFSNEGRDCQQVSVGILDGHMTVRPDFYWESKGIVLDAKNRSVWGETLYQKEWDSSVRSGVRDDLYQVLSYMLVLNCAHGGVIFPVSRSQVKKDIMEPSSLRVSGLTVDRKFWRIPFVIPDDAVSYEDFQRKIQAQADTIRGFSVQACNQE